MTLEVGIHEGITADDYHADPCAEISLSSSIARTLLFESPAHAWHTHPRLNPDFERVVDDKFDLGNVVHGVFLEGQHAVEVIDAADYKTKAAREARDAARAAGKTPILASQWPRVINTVTSIRKRILEIDVDPPLFRDGDPELVLVWRDKGVTCRARLDWLRTDRFVIDDLKTTSLSANPVTWDRRVYSGGYDVQSEFYSRGVEILTGERPEFRLVVVEVDAPHEVAVLKLAPDAQVIARKKVDIALALWRRCLDSGAWPGYPNQIASVLLSPWEEERVLALEERAVLEGWLPA